MLLFESADATSDCETVFAYAFKLLFEEESRFPDSALQAKFLSMLPPEKPECRESAAKAQASAFESSEIDCEPDCNFSRIEENAVHTNRITARYAENETIVSRLIT